MTTKPQPKPIAYANGTSGGVYHPECWFKHADEYFKDRRARAFLGALYYPGAQRHELKGVCCKGCGLDFTKTIIERDFADAKAALRKAGQL